ncbi:MAG: hypothetical protein U0176_27390 [Bacteroidia bacterium]
MNPLHEAVRLLTKEEVRAFKLYIQKVDTSGQRKDVELFDLIRKSKEEYDEDAAFAKLYPSTGKNAFHRLKSRLLHDINRCVVDLELENNDTLKLLHFVSVVEIYIGRRHFQLAFWFLRKAETLAERIFRYDVLDLTYTYHIQLSQELSEIDPNHYISLRKANQTKLLRMRELDDLLSIAIHRTKHGQTWGGGDGELLALLQHTVEEFSSEESLKDNPMMRIKLFQSVSNILLNKRQYATLERFVHTTYEQFDKDGLFNRNTHDLKLLMLTYRANALNKIGQYQESLKQAELLGRAMLDFEGMLQDKYLFFFYNALTINYYKTDLDKAIKHLEEMRLNEKIKDTPFYALFIDMNMAFVWWEKGNPKKAIKYIVAATHHPAYKEAGAGLRLRIAIAELMIRLRLGDFEVMEQRVGQVRQDFSALMEDAAFRREKIFLELLAALNAHSGNRLPNDLRARVQDFVNAHATVEEKDAELIDYAEFLKEFLA